MNDLAQNAEHAPIALTHEQRVAMFGHFTFRHVPLMPHPADTARRIVASTGDPEHVAIDDAWMRAHIVHVVIPQLGRSVPMHALVERQTLAMFAAWEAAGLQHYVKAFNGMQASRFKRQNGTFNERLAKCMQLGEQGLSNHAWGTAIDLNAQWNPLGHAPAPIDAEGTVLPLLPIAYEHGFAWGGNFHARPDGMHLEVCKVIA